MGNYKWCNNDANKDEKYVVVLFRSRNKDNKGVEGFKERKKSMFCRFNLDKIKRKFDYFVSEGVDGEMSRCYISVNARDPEIVKKKLLHELIDADKFEFEYLMSKVAGIAALKECAAEKKWMFDFDWDDAVQAYKFIDDVHMYAEMCNKNEKLIKTELHKTPHGYAVICNQGFDTRELLANWNRDAEIVTLKRDDLLCFDWRKKE